MATTENQTPAAALTAAPTFELKRFAWGMPDRLEVAGTFGGLHDTPADGAPVLIVKAGEVVHRLTAVPDSLNGPPQDGRVWQAQFAWQDPPVAFGAAELQLGADLVVELPEPSAKRRLVRARVLEVRTAGPGGADRAREALEVVRDPQSPADGTREQAAPDARSASVGSQVDLLAAQEEVREVRASLEQTQAELTRAREDLQAERERRAGDGERFREGLAKVRESAEHALTEEQATVSQLGTDLREALAAIETKDAAMEALRTQLEAADAARTQAEAEARAEIEPLRKQLAELESDGRETERLRSELVRRREQANATRTELEKAHSAVDRARSDAERLLGRLTAIRPK